MKDSFRSSLKRNVRRVVTSLFSVVVVARRYPLAVNVKKESELMLILFLCQLRIVRRRDCQNVEFTFVVSGESRECFENGRMDRFNCKYLRCCRSTFSPESCSILYGSFRCREKSSSRTCGKDVERFINRQSLWEFLQTSFRFFG